MHLSIPRVLLDHHCKPITGPTASVMGLQTALYIRSLTDHTSFLGKDYEKQVLAHTDCIFNAHDRYCWT
jgi:hypothetical protein